MRCRAGNTPLQWALSKRNTEAAKLLDLGIERARDYMDDDDYDHW